MDPASAVITFVGFAASLAALVAVVVDSAKTLNNLQKQLRAAPDNVKRLVVRFEILQSLLQEVQARSQVHGETEVPEGLRQIWEALAAPLKEDMDTFHVVVAGLEQTLNKSKGSSLKFRLRIRDFFSEPKVSEFEQKFQSHLGILQFIRTSIIDLKLDTVKTQNRKLESITLNGFQAVFSGLSTLESSGQQSNRLLERSNAGIEDYVQLLRSNLEVGQFLPTTGPRRRGKGIKSGVAAAVYVTVHNYVLPFGHIHVQVSRKSLPSPSGETIDAASKISQVSFNFVPPRWLSNMAIRSTFDILKNAEADLPGLKFKMNPILVNRNPLVVEAIEILDVAALRQLFTTGLARPSDHVIGPLGSTRSLLDHFCTQAWFHDLEEQKLFEMFRFLVEASTSNVKPYIEMFRVRGGSVCVNLDTWTDRDTILSYLVEFEIGFDSATLSEYLFTRSESWTIDDLMPIDFWIIGILAYTDQKFRARLEAYLECFRSPLAPQMGPSGKQSVLTAFDIDVIVAQFMSASTDLRVHFLSIICTSGTFRMLKPFLDAGIDINEVGRGNSYLGMAARASNLETFQILLDSGAAVGPALSYSSYVWVRAPAEDLPYYLQSMLDRITQIDFKDDLHDPILSLLKNWNESNVTASALEHFLCTGLFNHGRLFGGENIPIKESYILWAICVGQDRALSLFLEHAIDLQRQLGDQFGCDGGWLKSGSYTWLTLAVYWGRASCVEIIVKYADIHVRDGSGRNALESAREIKADHHTRRWDTQRGSVNPKDDDKILAILEKGSASQPIIYSESNIATRNITAKPDAEAGLFARGSWKNFMHSPGQLIVHNAWYRYLQHQFLCFRYTWSRLSKLSYTDALLMRFGYVLSYILLLFVETLAIVTWLRKLPAPPRSVLVAGVVLLLGLTSSLRFSPASSQNEALH
ncbi:hypothetical protein MMC27_002229 [Xylographa pallens]|nr:hypothetical protein [Xylographa pallens]